MSHPRSKRSVPKKSIHKNRRVKKYWLYAQKIMRIVFSHADYVCFPTLRLKKPICASTPCDVADASLESSGDEGGDGTSDGTGAGNEASGTGGRHGLLGGGLLRGRGDISLAGGRQDVGRNQGGGLVGRDGVVGGNGPVRGAGRRANSGGVGSGGGDEAAGGGNNDNTGSGLRNNGGAVSRAVRDIRTAVGDSDDLSSGGSQGGGRVTSSLSHSADGGSGESEKSGGTHFDGWVCRECWLNLSKSRELTGWSVLGVVKRVEARIEAGQQCNE